MIRVDLTGKRFERLVVEGFDSKRGNVTYWRCKCDCGCETIVARTNLGRTKSCGCFQKERTSETHRKYHDEYDLSGEYGIGYTSNTHSPFYFDIEDFDLISKYTWSENRQGYIICRRSRNKPDIFMHRLVLGTENTVDHKNGCPFDNRKANLREATKQQNAFNRECTNAYGVKGVRVRNGKYEVSIKKDGKAQYLGTYDSLDDAKKAREIAAKELFGEFAYEER